MNRRTFLGGAAASMGILGGGLARKAVQVAEHKLRLMSKHRNLFNGDCNFLFYNPELWQPEGGPYGVRAIERYLETIAEGGVDTLLFNPNTQVAWYPSKKVPTILDGYHRGDRAFARRISASNVGLSAAQVEQAAEDLVKLLDLYLDLADAQVDWLAECARISRQNKMSPWLSYRMNATHFSGAPTAPTNAAEFHDPKNRLAGKIPTPQPHTDAAWVGMNYGQPAVRQHMLALIRDGVESYDFEGLELDWLRHPVCLEPNAGAKERNAMTDWFAEIREMTHRRRTFYPMGMRLPGNLGYLRDIGIDVPEIVRQGLVDFLTFSNFWQTPWDMPYDELREVLGDNVTLYGGMEDAPNWLQTVAPALKERPLAQELQLAGDNAYHAKEGAAKPKAVRATRYLTASRPLMRANAAGKLVLGVDGLEQFNFFVTDQVRVPGQKADYSALRDLDQLDFLRGKEKHYCLNTCSAQNIQIWDAPEPLPVRIESKLRRAFRIPMCAEPTEGGLRMIVQVVSKRDEAQKAGDLGVSVNGGWPVFESHGTEDLLFPAGPYSKHIEEHAAWNYACDVAAVRDGWNEVVLYNQGSQGLEIVSLEIGFLKA